MSAAEEHIAAVQQQIDLLLQRRLQGLEIVGQEIIAPAPALHARPQGCIQPEMGVGQKQQPDDAAESLRHSDSLKTGYFCLKDNLQDQQIKLNCFFASFHSGRAGTLAAQGRRLDRPC